MQMPLAGRFSRFVRTASSAHQAFTRVELPAVSKRKTGFTLVELPAVSKRKTGFTLVELPAVSKRKRVAFTLVELLVVVAVIGLLVTMLLPAVNAARESARSSMCSNNLRQLGLALASHESAKGALPPGGIVAPDWDAPPGNPNLYLTGWGVEILPYVEHDWLYKEYDNTVINFHGNNWDVRTTQLSVQTCPTDELAGIISTWGITSSYKGVAGNGFWQWPGSFAWSAANYRRQRGPLHQSGQMTGYAAGVVRNPVRLKEIRDGLSRTFLLGESQSTNMFAHAKWAVSYNGFAMGSTWANAGGRGSIDFAHCTNLMGGANGCYYAFSSQHAGYSMNMLFCDGHVRSVAPEIDSDLWVASGTIDGGESYNFEY